MGQLPLLLARDGTEVCIQFYSYCYIGLTPNCVTDSLWNPEQVSCDRFLSGKTREPTYNQRFLTWTGQP